MDGKELMTVTDMETGKKSDEIRISKVTLSLLAVCAGLAIIGCLFLRGIIRVGTSSILEGYSLEKEKVSAEVYDTFYSQAYDYSEREHHVSNRVNITVQAIQEKAALEVLTAWGTTVIAKEKAKNFFEKISDFEAFLLVPGKGIYTVNLQAAEFIVDNARHYVLIRIPEPELTSFEIDYSGIEKIVQGGKLSSAKEGEDFAREAIQDADYTIREQINTNQEFYKKAKENAQILLEKLVKQLNPDIMDLVVDVEFQE